MADASEPSAETLRHRRIPDSLVLQLIPISHPCNPTCGHYKPYPRTLKLSRIPHLRQSLSIARLQARRGPNRLPNRSRTADFRIPTALPAISHGKTSSGTIRFLHFDFQVRSYPDGGDL